jgi:hypothetical protein
MARPENSLDSVEIRISTNPIIKAHLEALVRTGRYGKNYAEAAERIIAGEIGQLVEKGKLNDPKES